MTSPQPDPVSSEPDTVEVGATGGDLPFWRAQEAMRHAEIRLAGQVQATQALEGRAASMIGWSVAGLLALGAAVAGGTHVASAAVAATFLAMASLLCVHGILGRDFSGVPGYEPMILLADTSSSEYEALVSLAKGYQLSSTQNALIFKRFKLLLAVAIILMVLAPLAGLAALLTLEDNPAPAGHLVIASRAAPALAVCRAAAGSSECVP